jgi:ER-derived vesicles protein
MAQLRGSAGSYGIPAQNPFGGPSEPERNDSNPLDVIREQTSKIEDLLDTVSEPIKPYVKPRGVRFVSYAR